jgi:hypothetical protein
MSNDIVHHVGKLNNTDRRCVVVYPTNPHNPNMALVVDTDALPPRLHDALMDVVQKEGQTTNVLANVLQRRVFTDTGVDLMNTLFAISALQAQPIENVTLFPRPNMPIPLAVALGRSSAQPTIQQMMEAAQHEQNLVQAQSNQSIRPPMEAPEPMSNAVIDTFNPHAHNTVAGRVEENIAIAHNIILEAEMLEGEAARKREQAYKIAPSLRPREVAAPVSAPAAQAVGSDTATVTKPARKPTTAKKTVAKKPARKQAAA